MSPQVPLEAYVIIATLLFGLGLFGALRRTNAILILMSIELMLNAVNINLIAFARYLGPDVLPGQIFSIFVITVAAAEAAVGLGIILMLSRRRNEIDVRRLNLLRG